MKCLGILGYSYSFSNTFFQPILTPLSFPLVFLCVLRKISHLPAFLPLQCMKGVLLYSAPFSSPVLMLSIPILTCFWCCLLSRSRFWQSRHTRQHGGCFHSTRTAVLNRALAHRLSGWCPNFINAAGLSPPTVFFHDLAIWQAASWFCLQIVWLDTFPVCGSCCNVKFVCRHLTFASNSELGQSAWVFILLTISIKQGCFLNLPG